MQKAPNRPHAGNALSRPTVKRVTNDGRMERRKVRSQLMCSPGHRSQEYGTLSIAPSQHLELAVG